MAAVRKAELNPALKGGVFAGLIGGVVLSVYTILVQVVRGMDVWPALKGAAAPFLGARAMQPGFDATAVLLGLVSHFAVSIAWGAGFGLLFYGLTRGATIVAGLFWGLVVWLGMFYVVLPIVGLGDMARSIPIAAAVLEHLLFGLSVGIAFLPFQRRAIRPLRPSVPAPGRPVRP